jgi:DNA modification methylase
MTSNASQRLLSAIHCPDEICGLTHNLYRYPARFSPYFVRAAIEEFSRAGDLVFDPFMGGGTALVEASVLGRKAVGIDINSLAVFVSKAKTQTVEDRDVELVALWAQMLASESTIRYPAAPHADWVDSGYLKHLNSRATWRVRKMITIALDSFGCLDNEAQTMLARVIILRTAQWALDNRERIPTVEEFRNTLQTNATEMTNSVKEYSAAVRAAMEKYCIGSGYRPICLHRSAVGVEQDRRITSLKPPALVLTSPPYPGVHILYHRWQVQGRRESPAPFWIANSRDGEGASYYTFGDRHSSGLKKYFSAAEAAFRSVARICDRETVIIQMIAFSEPDWQLPAYLAAMERAGLRELSLDGSGPMDSRIWRKVPNRKWYACWRKGTPSSSEVVLFHKLA